MEQSPERESLFNAGGHRGSVPNAPYTEITVTRPTWTKLLFLAGLVTTLGSSMPVGYNIGVVNAPADVIKSFCNSSVFERYHSSLSESSLTTLWASIVSIFLVGGTIGSLTGSYFADKIGRKGAILVSSVFGTISGILFISAKSANSFEMLLIARFLIGVSSGLITSVIPMYLTELAPKALRGSTGVLCPLGVTFGVLLGQVLSLQQVLGNGEHWPLCLAIYAVPQCLSSIVFFFMPESPKYLFVIRKKPHLALKQLARIRGIREELLNAEIEELKMEEQENRSVEGDSWSLVRVLKDKTLLLPLMLVCSLQAGQQFSGINAVFYYSVLIFKKAGLSQQNSEFATIAAGCINLLMAIISIPVMAKYKRRSTLQLSLASTTFFLLLLGVATSLISKFPWMAYFSIVGVLGYVLCYGIALGPIPYFIGSELFEVGPRPSAMALGSMSNWGGNFVVGQCFPLLQQYMGAAVFFLFAGFVIALFFFTRFYLPETKGRDQTEVAILCKEGLASRPLDSPGNSTSTVETFPIEDLKE